MFDIITFIEVAVVVNIGKIFKAVGCAAEFVMNLFAAPFSMYKF